MSDQPLFQNADEEEEKYAPQQLPQDADPGTGVGVVPAVGGAFQPGDASPGATVDTAPVLGAAALAQESKQRDHEDQENASDAT